MQKNDGGAMNDMGLDMTDGSILRRWLIERTEAAPVWMKTSRLFSAFDEWAISEFGTSCPRRFFIRAVRNSGAKMGRLSDGPIVYGRQLISGRPSQKPKPARQPNLLLEATAIGVERDLKASPDRAPAPERTGASE